MKRRELLIGAGAALLLAPGIAWAKKEKDPKLLLDIGGTLSHRGQAVSRDKVALRIAVFDSGMGRKVIWEQTIKVGCEEGAFSATLAKLGTVAEPALPDSAHLEVWVMDAGPHVSEVRLTPRIALDWAGSGSAECLEVRETSGVYALDAGGSCTLSGQGAILVELTTLQRRQKD